MGLNAEMPSLYVWCYYIPITCSIGRWDVELKCEDIYLKPKGSVIYLDQNHGPCMCYTLHGSRLVDAMGELNPLLKRCGGTDYRFGTDKCHHSTAGAVSSKCESRVSLYAKHLQNPRVPRLPFGSRVFFFFFRSSSQREQRGGSSSNHGGREEECNFSLSLYFSILSLGNDRFPVVEVHVI